METRKYQYDYSALEPEMSDSAKRERKGKKILSVLADYYNGGLRTLDALDIGCSMGYIDNLLCGEFRKVVGIDIDAKAINHAKEIFAADNLHFMLQDGIALAFDDNAFDVIICNHVYEHVPDSAKLFSEIRRALKPGGICYLAAANRLTPVEPHHRLLFLSWLPKALADVYVRLSGKGGSYYENLLTLYGLRKLARDFQVVDYTKKILADPVKYSATEMVMPKSFKQAAAVLIADLFYWLVPTYVWLLKKRV